MKDHQHNPIFIENLTSDYSWNFPTPENPTSFFVSHSSPCLTVEHSSASGRLILQDLGYFSAVDAGSGNGWGGDEFEHVAARRSHGGRHRWSRARWRSDAFVTAPATVEPTCGCLSPRFTRRRHPRQSGGDHVEFLVRHGHRRVAENRRRRLSVSRVIEVDSQNFLV